MAAHTVKCCLQLAKVGLYSPCPCSPSLSEVTHPYLTLSVNNPLPCVILHYYIVAVATYCMVVYAVLYCMAYLLLAIFFIQCYIDTQYNCIRYVLLHVILHNNMI
jgi:hypothetical protein